MATITPNPQNVPVFEIPTPPEAFGEDGVKFYKAYDTLAAEVDEDMTTSLKEQLDGMLVFAGLFAGVNTAFLALTIPLLTIDPSEDTNALLVQNNAILIQLVMGRNDSFPNHAPLPSAGFSPSSQVFAINALFALSLAFAIISSFLAVLGRQWLVYYRKRSGGGPDRQRWEQLKRFLGAQRWGMELMLDDVLPSLLQTGLIIFCISLLIYLHYLSPAISVIVGIPLYLGLAFFIGSALCTLWDRFCPFHSPLSHLLSWSVKNVPRKLGDLSNTCCSSLRRFTSRVIRRLKQRIRRSQRSPTDTAECSYISYDTEEYRPSNFNEDEMKLRPIISVALFKRWLEMLTTRRKEETPESLQVIALLRAICTSDDPMTLLHATANIVGITDAAQMEQLWCNNTFRERFLHQYRSSYFQMFQLKDHDQILLAITARRLYCGAAAHIVLSLDHDGSDSSELLDAIKPFNRRTASVLEQDLLESPACMVRTSLTFTLLQFCTYFPLDETVESLLDCLATASNRRDCRDWRLLCIISWVISNRLVEEFIIDEDSIESLRKAYRGDKESAFTTLGKALEVLIGRGCRDLVDADRLLTNLVQYIRRYIGFDQAESDVSLEDRFTLLKICEKILHSPHTPDAARHMVRKLRFDLAQVWILEYRVWVGLTWNTESLLGCLEAYLLWLTSISQTHSLYDEYIQILSAFGPPIRKLLSQKEFNERSGAFGDREPFRHAFNELVSIVVKMARQKKASRVRDSDERWCHWEEESFSVEAAYFLPTDSTFENSWSDSEQFAETPGGSRDPADSVNKTTLSGLVVEI